MSDDIQNKLDKLERIEQANRARSKKYLQKIKAQGKRQVSVILPDATIKEINRLRDESIATGNPLTYGDIITNAINKNVNIDTNKTLIENLKNANNSINKDVNTISDTNGKSDVNDFSHGNIDTNSELYKKYLDKILMQIPPGQWKKQAEILNQKGIKTTKGLPWTSGNLLFACKKFKK